MLKRENNFSMGVIFLFLIACNSNVHTEKWFNFNKEGWHQDSTKHINLSIDDTTEIYSILFYLRTDNSYPFRNIYFFSNVIFPDSSFFRDTISFNISDERGKRIGIGSGPIKTYKMELSKGKFPLEGTYSIQLRQGMRKERLMGIKNIGVLINKIDEKE